MNIISIIAPFKKNPNPFKMKKNLTLLTLTICGFINICQGQIKKIYGFPFDEANGIYHSNPQGKLVIIGNKIFGTTAYGPGSANYGYVYNYNLDSNSFSIRHEFICATESCQPVNGMVLSGGKFYGMLGQDKGGPNNNGTVYSFDSVTNTVTRLFNFNGASEGKYAGGIVTVVGNTIYGNCLAGGSINNGGTLWQVQTNGTGFKVLHDFKGGFGYGASANGAIIFSDSILYGTTWNDGDTFNTPQPITDGTLYSFDLRTNKYTLLKKFDGSTGGKNAAPGMVLLNNILYGTCAFKGANDAGNLFSYNLNTKEFKVLHEFNVTDGSSPRGLTLNGTKLYGTTYYGGTNGHGVIYSYNTANDEFRVLDHFKHDSTGAWPWDAPTIVGNMLYGTCTIGGTPGGGKEKGTIWSFKDTSIAIVNTGIEDFGNHSKVNIYPNPFKDEINVTADHQINEIKIISPDGKLIRIVKSNDFNANVDLTDVKPGVYFIQVYFANSISIEKLIKM